MKAGVVVERLDPLVPSGEWSLKYIGEKKWMLQLDALGFEKIISEEDGLIYGGRDVRSFVEIRRLSPKLTVPPSTKPLPHPQWKYFPQL